MSNTPTTPSDPQAMPLADLKQAAGLNPPAAQPESVSSPAPTPVVPVVPEKYSIAQDDNGVTITLSPEYGGEVYKGKDFAEAIQKMAGAKADANAYIKQLKTQPVQTTPQPQTPPAPQIDPAVQATRDWMLDEVAKGLGLKGKDELVASIGQMSQTTGAMQTNISLTEFHRLCPDYVDTPENSQAIGAYFPADMERFPTAQELKQAYALAVYEGKIKPQSTPPATPTVPRPPVMPIGGSTPPGAADSQAWTMPLADLKKAAGLG